MPLKTGVRFGMLVVSKDNFRCLNSFLLILLTDSLERASKSIDIPSEESEEHITRLKRSIKELERHHELLRQENENLQVRIS